MAEALRLAADKAQMNDVQIAAAVGVNQQSVRNWMSGKYEPRPSKLFLLIQHVPDFGKLIGLELAA